MKKKTFLLCISLICLFVLSSCGLDTLLVLYVPTSKQNDPNVESLWDKKYFDFWTSDTTNQNTISSEYTFLGTNIFYKIYNNTTTMNSEISTISTISNSTNYQNAIEKLTNVKSSGGYGYKQLKASGSSATPIVPASLLKINQRVYIRLTDYNSSSEYSSRFTIDDSSIGQPRRDNGKNFNFGRSVSDSNAQIPSSSDSDVEYSSTFTAANKWYVVLYAVSVARDSTYTNQYSNVINLGAVMIDSSEIYN
ncbi:MAG: hypothetical protein GX677_11110 [Treponema sp.]|nr:hypothetical protein [Treponema sp.]